MSILFNVFNYYFLIFFDIKIGLNLFFSSSLFCLLCDIHY